MRKLFWCILVDRYVNLAALCPAEFSGKMRNFLRYLVVVIISLTHMLPAWLLASALYMCPSPSTLIFLAFIVLNSNYFGRIQIYFKLIYMLFISLFKLRSLKSPLRDSERPPDSPAPLTLATPAFPLIMFTSGIISTFYLILLSACFSDIHPGHNETVWD